MPDGEIIRLSRDPATGQFTGTIDGQRIMLSQTPQDVHDPTELPTYLAGYSPFGYRADEASRVVGVEHDEDKYRQFSVDDAFRRVEVKGSLSGAVPEVDPKSSLQSYKVVERYIGSFIPETTRRNAGSNPNYDPRMAAGRRCMNALQLDREHDVWALLGASATWDTKVRTAAGVTWDTTGDPIKDVQTAIEKSYTPVTEIWLNQKLAHAFLRNTNVRDHMRQMLGDNAPGEALGRVANAGQANVDFVIPGLPPFRVVASKEKNDATGALEYCLATTVCVLVTTVPGNLPVSGEDIASTHTFRRNGPAGVGIETREYFVEGRGPHGGTMLVTTVADVIVMTSNLAGGIITACHS